jgi:hypothetical protein
MASEVPLLVVKAAPDDLVRKPEASLQGTGFSESFCCDSTSVKAPTFGAPA